MEGKWWFFFNRWSFWAEIFAKRLKTAWVCYDLHFWPFSKKKIFPEKFPKCTQGSPLHFFKKFLKNNKKNTSQRNQLSTCFFVQMSNFSAKNLERHGFWTDFSKFWVSFYFFFSIWGYFRPIVTHCDTVWHSVTFWTLSPQWGRTDRPRPRTRW